jgi:hypothetical protein
LFYDSIMSRFASEYRVGRPTGLCASTGAVLEPGSAYIATLCERAEDDALERRDFSIESWEAGHRPEGLFSYWKAVVPHHDSRQRLLIDDEVLVSIFERLEADDRPRRAAFRFVLALILMRKRRLKYIGREVRGDQEWWVFVPRGSAADQGDPPQQVSVHNPRLNDEDIRELTDQLSEVLQSDF